jgi:acetyltransferase EpsM
VDAAATPAETVDLDRRGVSLTAAARESGPRELILIGGGEHAHVVLDAVRGQAAHWSVIGFVDPRRGGDLEEMGLAWLGDDDSASDTVRGRCCIVAIGEIGDTDRREAIVNRYASLGVIWATVMHDRAVVSPSAVLEPGVTVLAGAVVNHGARVGAHGIVNTGAIVEHGVDLEPFVHIGPGAVIGGGTAVGRGAYIGLGARVRDHIRIGAHAVIGMGAVVIKDVANDAMVVGVPALPIRRASVRSDAFPGRNADE